MFCTATGKVEKQSTHGNFFAFCFVGSFQGELRWAADRRTRGAILRRTRAPARAGDRSGDRAPGKQRCDCGAAGNLGGHGAARGNSLWLPSGLRSDWEAGRSRIAAAAEAGDETPSKDS